jgi:hypothetical protein
MARVTVHPDLELVSADGGIDRHRIAVDRHPDAGGRVTVCLPEMTASWPQRELHETGSVLANGATDRSCRCGRTTWRAATAAVSGFAGTIGGTGEGGAGPAAFQ